MKNPAPVKGPGFWVGKGLLLLFALGALLLILFFVVTAATTAAGETVRMCGNSSKPFSGVVTPASRIKPIDILSLPFEAVRHTLLTPKPNGFCPDS